MLPKVSLENGGSNSDSNNLDDSSEAAMSLAVRSKDELQLTVTKTCLDVFNKLGAVRKEMEFIVLCMLVLCLLLQISRYIFTSVGF